MNANEYFAEHGSTLCIAVSRTMYHHLYYFPSLCTLERGEDAAEVCIVAVQDLREYMRRDYASLVRIIALRFASFAVLKFPDFGVVRAD
ncbi:MAG: hypothetical protein RML84_11415, partial [Anaerolineae bacterium]|nr:hypothetical protein [Anaerolineae bacterium]